MLLLSHQWILFYEAPNGCVEQTSPSRRVRKCEVTVKGPCIRDTDSTGPQISHTARAEPRCSWSLRLPLLPSIKSSEEHTLSA